MRHRVEDDQCGFRQLQGENRSFSSLQVDPLERDLLQQAPMPAMPRGMDY